MSTYTKGEKPRDLDAACGGLVLGRLRSFAKDPDDYHPMGSGLSGPENEQKYDKKGDAGSDAQVKGDTKSLPMSKLKKSNASAL
jgi:hypothetical protein